MSNPIHVEFDLIRARSKNALQRVQRLKKRLAQEDGAHDEGLTRAAELIEQAMCQVEHSRRKKLG